MAYLAAVLKRLQSYSGDYLDLLPGMPKLPESRFGSTSAEARPPNLLNRRLRVRGPRSHLIRELVEVTTDD